MKRSVMKGKHKHTEASLKHFGDHRCLSQSEESKCMWTHGKDGAMWIASKCHQDVFKIGRVEGMEGKLNQN